MSSVLYRTHFQFMRNSLIVVKVNICFQSFNESVNSFKIFAIKHFDF